MDTTEEISQREAFDRALRLKDEDMRREIEKRDRLIKGLLVSLGMRAGHDTYRLPVEATEVPGVMDHEYDYRNREFVFIIRPR